MHRSAQKQGTSSSDWGVPPSWLSKLSSAQILFTHEEQSSHSPSRAHTRASAVFRFPPSHFTGMQQQGVIHWIRCEGNAYFLFTFLTQQISPLLSNKITDWACRKCRSDVRNRYAAGSQMWCSHQDVRTGSKVGGKRKHTQPSSTRKEKYPMERKEKQLTEGERNNW